MEWITLILTFLPAILELFDKAVKGDTQALATIRFLGEKLSKSPVAESVALGIVFQGCAKNPKLLAAQRNAFALKNTEMEAAYAKLAA